MTLVERLGKLRPRGYAEEMSRFEARRAMAAAKPVDSELGQVAVGLLENKVWAGWLVEWAQDWAGYDERKPAGIVLTEIVRDHVPMGNLVSNRAVLDISNEDCVPGVAVAMIRPDSAVVLPVRDPALADWLEATLERLEVDNAYVARERIEGIQFGEIICRDQRDVYEILRRSKRWIGLGGRWYLLRHQIEAVVPDGMEFIQKIPMGKDRWVLHFAGIPEQPGVSAILRTGGLLLDRIEAEMKQIGFWNENPPELRVRYESGELSSYLDAPSFEIWLQCVFLVNARKAVESDDWPEGSQVSDMAWREYSGHSDVPESSRLIEWLRAFDLLVKQRHSPGLELTGRQAVSVGGRLLTKGVWKEPAWESVDVTPYDPKYFPLAVGELARQLEVTVSTGADWELSVGGSRVEARMEYRQSCSIGCKSVDVRDLIFRVLTGLAF